MNPADLVTRGLTFIEFSDNIQFWNHGPDFFNCYPIEWPEKSLSCLSNTSKLLTMSMAYDQSVSIFPIDRFSDQNKLFRVTALAFKFIGKLKKCDTDYHDTINQAKKYWIKNEQKDFFADEINFLSIQDRGKNIPPRVNHLNLFLDSDSILRSKVRLSKCEYLSYDQNNPILVHK